MDSPFRNIASIAEFISGGEDVSRALLDVIEPLKDAPAQFKHLATNIGQCGCLLACALHLFQQHHMLFKAELANLLSDVNGHFGIIQETVKRWIKFPRGRWRRMKWLYWSGRIADFVRRLQALMSCLDVLVGVATIAIDKSEDVAAWQLVLHRSQALRSIEEARFQTAHLHRSHADREPVAEVPRPYRVLLTLGESGRDVAEWMSTVLSAPAVPLSGTAGGPPPQGIIKYERSRYAFAPTTRPNPEFEAEGSRLVFAHESICLGALSRLGLQYTIEDCEERENFGRKVIVQIEKAMKEFEVDLIVSTSQVVGARPSPEWKPSTSPWMRLPPEEALARLLKSCTLLSDERIESILGASTPPSLPSIWGNGDTAHGKETRQSRLKFSPDLEGEEFIREEFERSESLRDWAPHPPVQADAQRMTSAKWDNRSRISDGNMPPQSHVYPMMPPPQTQLMLSAPPMPTLHESPPVGRRVSYPLGLDPSWMQDFQEKMDLREQVKDLEQKLRYSKEEAKVSVIELENKLDGATRAERELAMRLDQEGETQSRFEKELKSISMEREQLESINKKAKTQVDDMKVEINGHKEEIARLKGELCGLEAVSAQTHKSEETQRGMEVYMEQLQKWKMEMVEQQATLEHQWREVSDQKVAALRQDIMKELAGQRQSEEEQSKLQDDKEKLAMQQKLSDLEQGKEADTATIEGLREKASLFEKEHEDEVQFLTARAKRLEKRKTKVQVELQCLKDSQDERVQVEKEVARAAAILEFQETLHKSAKEAVQKEMNDATEKQAEMAAKKQVMEPEMEVDWEMPSAKKEPSILSNSEVDVMSFVVDDDNEAGGADWPDAKTETDDGIISVNPGFTQDTTQVMGETDDENANNHVLEREEPQRNEGARLRAEDFLVGSGTEDDPGYKNMRLAVSKPWKGMGGIEPPAFENIGPLYVRGNGMGQTLYCGANPIHIRELSENYKPDGVQQYLTVSKLYLDPRVLRQFGVDFVEMGDGYLLLDATISVADIEKLFHQSYIDREIRAFKTFKNRGYKTSVIGHPQEMDVGEEDGEDLYGDEDEEDDGQQEGKEGSDEEDEREARTIAGTCRAS